MIFDVYTALRHMAADGKTITLTDNESIRYSHSKYYNRIGWIENRADGMVNEGSIGIDYWVKENEQRMFELYQEPEEPGPVYAVGDPYTDITGQLFLITGVGLNNSITGMVEVPDDP